MANPAPGFKKRPDHRIAVSPVARRVRVVAGGELLADTGAALAMKEGDYPLVYYFPRKDVRMDRLERSTHSTHCPFKGDASYWSLEVPQGGGVRRAENAVWGYRTPFDEAGGLAGHMAFYRSRVDAIEVG